LRISNAQSVTPSPFITAPERGVLNVQRCKKSGAKSNKKYFTKLNTNPLLRKVEQNPIKNILPN